MRGHLWVAFFMALQQLDTRPQHLAERQLLHAGGRPSRWHNFGLWPAPDYGSACEALGCLVGAAAQLGPGDRILSLGAGAGEELALWTGRYGCAQAWGTDEADPDTAAVPPGTRVDAIVAVDAAYHFSPRAQWLAACARRLPQGGRLAYTDLNLSPTGLARTVSPLLTSPLLLRANIDVQDLLGPEEQARRLKHAGFENVQVQDLSVAVIDGFIAFETRQRGRLQALPGGLDSTAWRRVRTTAAAMKALRGWTALGFGYSLCSGTLRASSASNAFAADCADLTADSSSGTPSQA